MIAAQNLNFAGLMAITILLSSQQPAWGQPGAGGDPPGLIDPVHAPDVPGGYASTHIIIQVQPETRPRMLGDGRWTVDAADPLLRTPQMAVESVLLATALDEWFVIDISRGIEPANKELAAELGLDRYYKVRVPEGTDTPAMAEHIGAFDVLIERAEVDGIATITGGVIPNDALFSEQWALNNTGQTGGTPGADISAPEAWAIYNDANDDSIIVAILDTGVHAEHEDVQGRMIDGWNFIDDNDDPYDVNGHGTHVAGSAAATTDNGVGIAGVSWGARIMPVKVLGDGGSGSWFGVGDGVIFAADNGAHVANMSLAGGFNSYMEAAVQYGHASGMLLVAAAGNAGSGADTVRWPAKYPEVIAVAATNHHDNRASFSSMGPALNVAAPGVSILSLDVPTGYRLAGGTSMAAPHVAGLACLLFSQDPNRTHDDVWQILEATADSRGTPGHNNEYGYGRINAAAAVTWASAIHVPDHYSTIQAAINAAQDGDMIVVAPGTYNEAIDFGEKNIHLRSWNQPHSTVIDASGLDTSAVTIAGGQDAGAILHGFTITGGSGTNIDGTTFGGGVYVAGSSPTITGNRFLYNAADEGGAIFADSESSPSIGVSFFCGNEGGNITGSWNNLGHISFSAEPCEPVIAPLSDYAVTQGNALNSGLWRLEESDNEYLEIQSVHSSGRHRTSVTVEALSPLPPEDVIELALTIETGTTVSGVTTSVDLWNFSSSSWNALDSFSQPQPDTINEYPIDNLNAHLDDSGLIRMRFRTEAHMNPNSGGYVFRIDLVQFVLLADAPFEPEPGPIQQLINEATDGDEIVLEPGVYSDAINFHGKAITLRSIDPDDPDIVAATVIDATGLNTSAITMTSGEGPGTVVEGLTITGGTGTVDGNWIRGGGMYLVGASPTIENCVFIGNTADLGAGMYNYNSSPHVINCQFIENHSTAGGGMYNDSSSPTIEDCLFLANTSHDHGAAVWSGNNSNLTVIECVFDSNAASGIGTMLNFTGTSATVAGSVFVNNSAALGAAIYNLLGGTAEITDSTISGNVSERFPAVGLLAGSHATIENCIIEDNVATIEFGGVYISEDSSADIGGSFICDNDPDDLYVVGTFNDLGENEICIIVEPDDPDDPDDPDEPFVAPLLDYEIEIGVQLGGFDLDWLTEINQQYLRLESDRVQGRHRTNTIIDVNAGTAPIVQLDVHTVSGLETAPPSTVTTFIELWHVGNGEWIAINAFEQNATGDHYTNTNVANPNAYVAGDGTMRVRVRSEAPGNPHQPPYVYRIDYVEVFITPEGE